MPFIHDTPAFDAPKGAPATGGDIDERYIAPLVVSVLHHRDRDGRTLAVLAHAFTYANEKRGERITVEAFFETDFASVPSFAQGFIQSFGRHAKAAVLHDWLYADGKPSGRDRADRLFCLALRELGVAPLTRLAMYLAVRLFGGKSYGRVDEWLFADPRTGLRIDPPRPPQSCTAHCDAHIRPVSEPQVSRH